jgi:hypothetical protein
MWIKVAVVALLLWYWSQQPAHGSKAASGDVSLGDDFNVDFQPDDGEWNPFYRKSPSLDLETPGAGAGVSSTSSNPEMRRLIDESDAAIRQFDAENPPL